MVLDPCCKSCPVVEVQISVIEHLFLPAALIMAFSTILKGAV